MRKQIARWLQKVYINNPLLFVDRWSFVHIVTGFLLMKYFQSFSILLAILVSWELFEFVVIKSGSKFFRKESMKDTVWDVIFGILGGSLAVSGAVFFYQF